MGDSDDDRDDEELEEAAEEVEKDISVPDVVEKYRVAGDIVNRALTKIIAEAKAGTSVVTLCEIGDNIITEGTKAVYNKGKMEKGIAFPTCISVNNCVGHYSPLASENPATLAAGDVVKCDLGAHIDGFIAVAAHTFVVGQDPQTPITGKIADVILAAHTGAEAALRLLKPGNKNSQVTEALAKVATTYGLTAVEGVLSHQMKRFVIDGNKVIMNKTTVEQKVEETTFEPNEVYAIDVVMSTGEGKPKELGDQRTTVFKRAVDQSYNLKMKASRQFLSEISTRFPTLPFTLRAVDEKKGRLGVVECVKHELLHQYPVLYEKPGDIVAQFKYTVLLLPSGPTKITGLPLPAVKSDKRIEDPGLRTLLTTALKKKSKPKKKKSKATGGASSSSAMATEEDDDEEGEGGKETMDTS